MITKAQFVGIYVTDQQRALEFYRDKLGFEVKMDMPMGDMGPEGQSGEVRWIDVAPPGAETSFTLYTPPGMEGRIGGFSNIAFDTDDIQKTYQDHNEKGVEFTVEPKMEGWGWWAQFTATSSGSGSRAACRTAKVRITRLRSLRTPRPASRARSPGPDRRSRPDGRSSRFGPAREHRPGRLRFASGG
jgi:lactoylglutathione lyase